MMPCQIYASQLLNSRAMVLSRLFFFAFRWSTWDFVYMCVERQGCQRLLLVSIRVCACLHSALVCVLMREHMNSKVVNNYFLWVYMYVRVFTELWHVYLCMGAYERQGYEQLLLVSIRVCACLHWDLVYVWTATVCRYTCVCMCLY